MLELTVGVYHGSYSTRDSWEDALAVYEEAFILDALVVTPIPGGFWDTPFPIYEVDDDERGSSVGAKTCDSDCECGLGYSHDDSNSGSTSQSNGNPDETDGFAVQDSDEVSTLALFVPTQLFLNDRFQDLGVLWGGNLVPSGVNVFRRSYVLEK